MSGPHSSLSASLAAPRVQAASHLLVSVQRPWVPHLPPRAASPLRCPRGGGISWAPWGCEGPGGPVGAGPLLMCACLLPGGAVGTGADTDAPAEPTAREVPTRVSPYSVIDIAPFQEEQCPPAEPGPEDDGVSLPVPSGYSVPVPCGYAVPCNLPLLLPAYSSPVVARAASLHGEGAPPPCTPQATGILFVRPAVPGVKSAAERTQARAPVPLQPPCGPRRLGAAESATLSPLSRAPCVLFRTDPVNAALLFSSCLNSVLCARTCHGVK